MMKFRSKNEEEVYNLLVEIFPHTFIQHDYNVGGGLMLDFYIDVPCRLGFEVDGAQHFDYNSMFHKDIEAFHDQLERDKRKKDICVSNGITLIRIDARKKITKEIMLQKIYGVMQDVPKQEKKEKFMSDKRLKFLEDANLKRKAARALAYQQKKERRKR
jgi:hypothetical protein